MSKVSLRNETSHNIFKVLAPLLLPYSRWNQVVYLTYKHATSVNFHEDSNSIQCETLSLTVQIEMMI